MEGQQFPPELLQREVRSILGRTGGTLVQQNFPSSRQIASGIRELIERPTPANLFREVAAAKRDRRRIELLRAGGGVALFSDERPSNQERLQRTATPPTAPAPAPSPARNLLKIRNTQAVSQTPTTFYYQKDRGQPSVSARRNAGYDYIDKGGMIGDEDRFPTGTPRVWRLLETNSRGGQLRNVLALKSEMRPDGTFPPPASRGEHKNRATMSMNILQDLVDGGQIGIDRLDVQAFEDISPEPEPDITQFDPKRAAALRGVYEPFDPTTKFDNSDL